MLLLLRSHLGVYQFMLLEVFSHYLSNLQVCVRWILDLQLVLSSIVVSLNYLIIHFLVMLENICHLNIFPCFYGSFQSRMNNIDVRLLEYLSYLSIFPSFL